jgi:hypothetical protein
MSCFHLLSNTNELLGFCKPGDLWNFFLFFCEVKFVLWACEIRIFLSSLIVVAGAFVVWDCEVPWGEGWSSNSNLHVCITSTECSLNLTSLG